jgi:hypothetical protein
MCDGEVRGVHPFEERGVVHQVLVEIVCVHSIHQGIWL